MSQRNELAYQPMDSEKQRKAMELTKQLATRENSAEAKAESLTLAEKVKAALEKKSSKPTVKKRPKKSLKSRTPYSDGSNSPSSTCCFGLFSCLGEKKESKEEESATAQLTALRK